MIKLILKSLTTVALFVLVVEAGAQAGTEPFPPHLVSHGRGEIEVVPDRVELLIRVETRAGLAGRASEDNARISQAVLDTLRRGFRMADGDLSTAGYTVRPEMAYPGDGRPPRVTGYVATNVVRVRTGQTDRVGAIIDAAVGKGSTGISGPRFYVEDENEARRRALALAVQNARRDAETMASAAGGRLGELLELVSEAAGPRYAEASMVSIAQMRAADVETPIDAAAVRVSSAVVGKWRFLPAGS
jgi:hypothetical protein